MVVSDTVVKGGVESVKKETSDSISIFWVLLLFQISSFVQGQNVSSYINGHFVDPSLFLSVTLYNQV